MNYCIISHMKNCKPTFAPPEFVKHILWSELTVTKNNYPYCAMNRNPSRSSEVELKI